LSESTTSRCSPHATYSFNDTQYPCKYRPRVYQLVCMDRENRSNGRNTFYSDSMRNDTLHYLILHHFPNTIQIILEISSIASVTRVRETYFFNHSNVFQSISILDYVLNVITIFYYIKIFFIYYLYN